MFLVNQSSSANHGTRMNCEQRKRRCHTCDCYGPTNGARPIMGRILCVCRKKRRWQNGIITGRVSPQRNKQGGNKQRPATKAATRFHLDAEKCDKIDAFARRHKQKPINAGPVHSRALVTHKKRKRKQVYRLIRVPGLCGPIACITIASKP